MDRWVWDGWFKFEIVDCAVNTSRSELPQFQVELKAVEFFDEKINEKTNEIEGWIDWTGYEEVPTIMGYFILVSKEGKSIDFNIDGIKEALDWDGKDLAYLDDADARKGTIVLVRVDEEEYQGKTRFKPNQIKHKDGTPGGDGVRRLDADAVKAMSAKYGKLFSGSAAPATAKPKPAPAAAPKLAPAPAPESEPEPEDEPEPKKKEPPKRGRKKGSKAKEKKDPKWDVNTAWKFLEDQVDEKELDVDQEALVKAWEAAIDNEAPDCEYGDITQEQWASILRAILVGLEVPEDSIPF